MTDWNMMDLHERYEAFEAAQYIMRKAGEQIFEPSFGRKDKRSLKKLRDLLSRMHEALSQDMWDHLDIDPGTDPDDCMEGEVE